MQAVLSRLAWKQVGTPHPVENIGNLYENIAGIAVGLLLVARELGAKMADPAW